MNTIKEIMRDDERFPSSLTRINKCPEKLFVQGQERLLTYERENIAIIGTREPTKEAEKVAYSSAAMIAQKGYNIVSGMAKGCDTSAHEGCLDVEGKTIAVLAHGLDFIQKKETSLASRICASQGALVTEYQNDKPPQKYTFIERDRIQSGLSQVVILVQSQKKSGSMHTVKFAQEQGKKLWVYKPKGSSDSELFSGNLSLINQGNQGNLSIIDESAPRVEVFESLDDLENLVKNL